MGDRWHPARASGNQRRPGRARRRRGLAHLGGKASLSGDPAFARELAYALDTGDDPGRALTHGFHAYPARMHPLTAARVIAARLGDAGHAQAHPDAGYQGQMPPDMPHGRHGRGTPGWDAPLVVDPFCGSGSVAVEALRAGARFVGGDISPIALEIAWVRTRVWPLKRCSQVERRAAVVTRRARQLAREDRPRPPWVIAEASWYDIAALRDVWALRDAIDGEEDDQIRRVLLMVLSSIVVKVSKQVSDATTVRDRGHQPVRPGVALHWFERRAHELAGQLAVLYDDLALQGVKPIEPHLVQADARAAGLVEPHTASLVLTSSPYPGTYDYLLHHARRYAVLGMETDAADRQEIGSRRRMGKGGPKAVAKYEQDLAAAIGRMREALRPGGSMILLIGDGTLGRQIIRADELVQRIASRTGLAVAAGASQGRPNWLGGKGGPMRMEHLMELRQDRLA